MHAKTELQVEKVDQLGATIVLASAPLPTLSSPPPRPPIAGLLVRGLASLPPGSIALKSCCLRSVPAAARTPPRPAHSTGAAPHGIRPAARPIPAHASYKGQIRFCPSEEGKK
ncbi:hypothetical protein ACJQWK_04325 [Exserohilum turcicum]